MPAQKRKSRTLNEDSFINDDSDDGNVSTKRSKPSSTSTFQPASSLVASRPEAKTDEEGSTYFEISKARRVTISDFKGKKMVSVREYYEKDGKWLPGKKGITMTLEQYGAFVTVIPQIEEILKESGEEVPRPVYDRDSAAAGDGNLKAEETDDDDGDNTVKRESRRANIEATSDEDEG